MEILLLRHGIAEDRAPSGRDEDRKLTDEGVRKLRRVLETARDAGLEPDLIITSPYVRAVQTAEAAADVLRYKGEMLRSDALVPDAEPADLWQEIRAHRKMDEVLLASHEPLMGRAAAYLLNTSQLAVDFKKAGLMCIEVSSFGPQPHGVLKWYITPKLAP